MLGRPGVTRKPYASHKPHKMAHAPFLLTLTCTLNPTPNPKPRLNASSKPKAEHEPSTLTNLALVDRSLIPFNSKPKSQKLKLNPKSQNPTTTPQGEERPHTPHHRGGGGPPISRPLTFGGGRGGAAYPCSPFHIVIVGYA